MEAWLNLFAIGCSAIVFYVICVKIDNRIKNVGQGAQGYRLEATDEGYGSQEMTPTDLEGGLGAVADFRYRRCDLDG